MQDFVHQQYDSAVSHSYTRSKPHIATRILRSPKHVRALPETGASWVEGAGCRIIRLLLRTLPFMLGQYVCMHAYVRRHVPTDPHTYLSTYIPTDTHTYAHTYMHMYMHTYMWTNGRTDMRTRMTKHMQTYVPTYLPPSLPPYLPTITDDTRMHTDNRRHAFSSYVGPASVSCSGSGLAVIHPAARSIGLPGYLQAVHLCRWSGLGGREQLGFSEML